MSTVEVRPATVTVSSPLTSSIRLAPSTFAEQTSVPPLVTTKWVRPSMSSSRAKLSPTGIGESPTRALTDGVVVVVAGVGTDDDGDVSDCVGDGSGRRLVTVGLLDLVACEVDDLVVATSLVACAELD